MAVNRILAIDDDEDVLSVLDDLLSRYGYTALTATNHAEGLKIAFSTPIDLLLLDLVLVEGDGYETLAEFRATFPDLPILVLTGLDLDDKLKEELLAAGATACLEKAAHFEQLLGTIHKLTRRPYRGHDRAWATPWLSDRDVRLPALSH